MDEKLELKNHIKPRREKVIAGGAGRDGRGIEKHHQLHRDRTV